MISRTILEALPDWFGIPEAREEYIVNSVNQQLFAAVKEEKTIGFLCLKQTGKDTVEVSVMGVLKEFHRHGIGRKLFMKAREKAIKDGFSFIQVKTVQMGQYDNYDNTNKFYISLGFKEFEIFPTLWDEWNPCQVYVMALL
nr:GNAT family N-acetyltransferase [Blautia caecimuris]